MSLTPAVIDALVASGVSVDQLAAAIKADLAQAQIVAERQVPWPKLRAQAFARDGEVCGYCGATDGPFEVDHIKPRSAGGENVLENVVVACRSCNRAKKDRDEEAWSELHARRERDKLRKRDKRAAARTARNVRGLSADKADLPPNDIYSNPPTNPLGAKAPCPPICQKVVEAWNDGPGKAGATDAKPLNADRRKALASRIREHGEPAVFDAIANVGRSPFHCGKNDRNWRANIGWLLKSPENFQKALEMTAPPKLAPQQTSAGQPSFLAHLQQRRAA